MFEPALVTYLNAHSALDALINGRVHPGKLPDPPVLPAVTYQRISTMRVTTYDGVSTEAGGRFQIDAWARTQGEARTVANELMNALLGFNGDMDGQYVQIPSMPNDLDNYEPETDLYRVITEFMIWHEVMQAT